MSQENRLEKTNRINLLFDFYELLLTEKQQTFLKYYFHDDFSSGKSPPNSRSAGRRYMNILNGPSRCWSSMRKSSGCSRSTNGAYRI